MTASLLIAAALLGAAVYCAASAALGASGNGIGKTLRMIQSDFRAAPKKAHATASVRIALRGAKTRLGPLERFVAGFVRMGPARRDDLTKKLSRARSELSPEEFCAKAVALTIRAFAAAPLLWLLGVKFAAAACAVLALTLYFKPFGDLEAKLKRVRSDIEDELPRFVSVINYSMATDRDLTRTIGKYLKICKPSFRFDLELLYLELKAGSAEDALRRFDSRLDIPQLSTFVSGLIDAGRGVDQKTFFYLMEENMKQLFVANKKKELAARPAKIRRAIIAAGLCLFILYLVPIGVQLTRGFSIFR